MKKVNIKNLKEIPTLTESLFRNRKLEVIRILLSNPHRETSIRELSKDAHVSYATTWKFVRTLKELGIINFRKMSNINFVSLNKSSPYIPFLRGLMKLDIVPVIKLAREFTHEIKKIVAVRSIIVFGSYAKGTAKPGSDLDILVIAWHPGEKTDDRIHEVASTYERKTGISFSVIVMSNSEFIRALKKKETFAMAVADNHIMLEGKFPYV